MEYLEDDQRKDVDQKVEELHERWMKLKNILENRMELSRKYVKFHMEADIVNKEMDKLDEVLLENKNNMDEQFMDQIEKKFESLIPLFECARNTGLTFIEESRMVSFMNIFSVVLISRGGMNRSEEKFSDETYQLAFFPGQLCLLICHLSNVYGT